MAVGVRVSIALALAACALAASVPGSATASARGTEADECRTSLQVRSFSQKRILKRNRVPVKVGACKSGQKVSLRAKTRIRAKEVRLTRRRTVTLSGERRLGLRLTPKGRGRLARCVPQRLTVTVATRSPGRVTQQAVLGRLDTDSPRCTNSGAGSPEPVALELSPRGAARHVNETPRAYALRGARAADAKLALVACEGLAPAPGELTRNGAQVEVSGADACVRPVAYLDANANDLPEASETQALGGPTTFEGLGDIELTASERCDFVDPASCLFPWPNDHFTIADASTETGKRLALDEQSMPVNNALAPVQTTEINRSDGFSPGNMIITKVPGLETPEAFANTGAPPLTDIERSLEEDSPIVVIDADSGERHLVFSELDANPTNPDDVSLLIRPAVNFEEGHRYIVALRNLKDADGDPIAAQRPFEILRDRVATSEPEIESRRPHFEELFSTLDEAGVERDDLYLAWDFTVASERNLSERMLSIRDDAFAQLGDTDLADMEVQGEAPSFAVTGVTDYEPCGNDGCQGGSPLFELGLPIGPKDVPLVGSIIGPTQDQLSTILGSPPEHDRIARKVEGQIFVPCYLNLPACPPGSQFAYSSPTDTIPDRLPGNVALANFTCIIPRAAVESGGGADPARPSLYGHGLLGGAGEVTGGNVAAMADEHNFTFCATDWAGFATQDLPTVALTLQDVSNFPRLVDRMQQGYLNFMFLGRAMIHPDGFAASPAFQFGGESVIDDRELFYDGNSQGGIMGGGLTAVAPDFRRAVLGVPGMNYSTLLRRSSDFAPYARGEFVDGVDLPIGLYDAYPNELERPLLLSQMQLLWDRGEANGYAHHMTDDPLANTPSHDVLLHVAYGDHQVSMWTAEFMARTVGAARHAPTTYPGRHPDSNPYFGIPPISGYPYDGSALIVFDSGPPRPGADGVVSPPTTNTPPDAPEYGIDPHSHPRNSVHGRQQKADFLDSDGGVVNVCGAAPCYANGFTGP